MKPAPPGWPRISTALYYADASAAIDWLCNAFGFEVRLKVEGEGGRIEHCELVFGEGLIMIGQVDGPTGGPTDHKTDHKTDDKTDHKTDAKQDKFPYRRTPAMAGGNTQNLMVYVDDVEAHCTRARGAGARITMEPKTTDYGEEYWTDRGYECADLGGHHWWFYQRLRDPKRT